MRKLAIIAVERYKDDWESLKVGFTFESIQVIPFEYEGDKLYESLEQDSLIICHIDNMDMFREYHMEYLFTKFRNLREKVLLSCPIVLVSDSEIDLMSSDWIAFNSLGAVYSYKFDGFIETARHIKTSKYESLSNNIKRGYAVLALRHLENELLELSTFSDISRYIMWCRELVQWIEKIETEPYDIVCQIRELARELRKQSIPDLNILQKIEALLNRFTKSDPYLHRARGRTRNLVYRHPESFEHNQYEMLKTIIEYMELILSGKVDFLVGRNIDRIKAPAIKLNKALSSITSVFQMKDILDNNEDTINRMIDTIHAEANNYNKYDGYNPFTKWISEVLIVMSDDAFRSSVNTVIKNSFPELPVKDFDNIGDAIAYLANFESLPGNQDKTILAISNLHLSPSARSKDSGSLADEANLDYGDAFLKRLGKSKLHIKVIILSSDKGYLSGIGVVYRNGIELLGYVYKDEFWESQIEKTVRSALKPPNHEITVGINSAKRLLSMNNALLILADNEMYVLDTLMNTNEPFLTAKEMKNEIEKEHHVRLEDSFEYEIPIIINGVKSKIRGACQREKLDYVDPDSILIIDESGRDTKYSIHIHRCIPQEEDSNVLIVEDDEFLSSILNKVLRFRNFIVTTAKTYEDAMDILKKNRFPIVTLDLSIPDKQSGGPDIKNGLLLLEYLRSQSPNTRVVVLTNYDTDEVKGAAVLRKLSPDRFVTKNRSDIGLFMADMVENLKEEWECDINHFSRGNLITLSRTDRTQCMINGKYFKDVCSSHLTKTDYELLKALANNERHIKREELIKYWVENMNKTQESFDSALKRLRTKLSDLTQLNKDGIILHLGDNTYYMPDFQIQIVD